MSKNAAAKTPVIEQIANLSMKLSQPYLAEYGATTSRHDFTQRQLLTCLVLRVYLKTTYRGVLDVLATSDRLRQCLGLEGKMPHYTTLQKFSARSNVVEIVQKVVARIGQQALPLENGEVAMDGTGLSRRTASEYFSRRSGKKIRGWVKLSAIVLCGSLLPLAFVVDLKPTNDRKHAQELLTQVQALGTLTKLYADKGYDCEDIHVQCREKLGVESFIPPIQRRPDGKIGGKWRAQMTPEKLKAAKFGRRWTVESYFSALKKTMGSAVSARNPKQMLVEAALKVLVYAFRR